MISGQQNQNIFLQILQYETLSASSSNHEKSASYFTWTEQSIVSFSSNYMSFSARVLHLLTFLGCSLWPEPFPVFFFLLLNICPLYRLQPDFIICSRMLCPVCLRKAMDKQGNVTFGTPIKTCYTVPVIAK